MKSHGSSIRSVIIGFAGLLFLMGCLAVDSMWQIHNVSATVTMLRKDARDRDALLDQMSNDVHRSATLARDYLLEHDEVLAVSQKDELRVLRARVDQSLTRYGNDAPPAQKAAIQSLQQHAEAYWTSLAPVLDWTLAVRKNEREVNCFSGTSSFRDATKWPNW